MNRSYGLLSLRGQAVMLGGPGAARFHGLSVRVDGLDRVEAFARDFRDAADASGPRTSLSTMSAGCSPRRAFSPISATV